MDLFTFVGIAGLFCLLFAFFLVEFGKTRASLLPYTLLNTAGSGFLILYSTHTKVWVFTILNTVWFIASIINLIRLERGNFRAAGRTFHSSRHCSKHYTHKSHK